MNVSKEEEFLLKWNNHQSNLISVFKDWLRDESFVDVSLVCGGEIVSGHKVVLAACSPLLNKILHNNPCRHPIVILNDVRFADMKALLKFIYQGEVSVAQSELASFLRTADNLQIKGLAEDKDKTDKKRKDKDYDYSSKKRQRTDYRTYASPLQSQLCLNVKNNSNTSSNLKPRKQLNNKERNSSVVVNFQQSSCGNIFSNSLETKKNPLANEEFQFDQNSLENDSMSVSQIVKLEPVEYPGDMVWPDTNLILNRVDTGQEYNQTTKVDSEASSSNIEQPQLPFPLLSDSSDGIELLSGNVHRKDGDENTNQIVRLENENRYIHGTSEEQDTMIMGVVEDTGEDDQISLGSPGKFRGGRKPCCFCGKTFCDNYTLRRHMVTHLTRQRQFECTLCIAAYSRKDHLMAHMRRKHPLVDFDIDVVAKQS